MFGFVGIMICPIVLAILITLISIYEKINKTTSVRKKPGLAAKKGK